MVENCIFPNTIQYGFFHQCTGEVLEASPRVRSLLFALRLGSRFSLAERDLDHMGEDGQEIRRLIAKEFLIVAGHDPLTLFLDQYVVRPIQNPALAYRSTDGQLLLVRTSMAQRIFSPGPDELPKVIEEPLEPYAATLLLSADGARTLSEIYESMPGSPGDNPLADRQFREAVEYLTRPHRQLIKFTRDLSDLGDPYRPCNIVPRSMYRSCKPSPGEAGGVVDFHSRGIDNASWEFDFVEPTINHGFRFSSEALGGLDYGSRFCVSTLRPEVLPRQGTSDRLEVLEVGGGTGTFARSFIEQATKGGFLISYHIVDLSPVLMQSQRGNLSRLDWPVQQFQQDATELNLPGHSFDLIIANEVIADFPVAGISRAQGDKSEWRGPGAEYFEKYDLADETAPDSFLLNMGALRFLEQAWEHLAPGGALVVSEYGGESTYPVQAYHLNHEEFSIHFGHLKKCAEQIGFTARLLTLKDFLEIDDQTRMLDGQEEQIMCLNYVFGKYGQSLPFALISEREFQARYQQLCERISLTGVSFSPLGNGFHFGPNLGQFMVLVMNKPE